MGAKFRSSLPGLTRQSIDLRKNFLAKKMDARVKPAHDEQDSYFNETPPSITSSIPVTYLASSLAR